MEEASSCPRAALSQLSRSNLNCRALSSKKRKFVEDGVHDPSLQPFKATLLPESNSKDGHFLIPIATISRSKLYLSYLDYTTGQTSLTSGRPFHADIAILNEDRSGQESKLLLARQAPNGGLYIIEKVGDGVFVACRLRGWVKEDSFGEDVNGCDSRDVLEKLCGDENQSMVAGDFRTTKGDLLGACKTVTTSPKRPKNRKGVLARMSIMPKIELENPSTISQERKPRQERHPAAIAHPARANDSADAVSSSFPAENGSIPNVRGEQDQSADAHETARARNGPEPSHSSSEIIASHNQVLLQTLYTSKSTLAYFTKSTLARNRADIRCSTTTSPSELADFYRSRLIPSRKMDLKYRDTIPKLIEKAVMQLSLDEGEAELLAKGTRKTTGRKKLGKDGLFAGEEAFVRAWWLSRDGGKNEISTEHSRRQEMQNLLTDLRNRETQLQIILILETMMLESREVAGPEEKLPPTTVKQESDQDESKSILAGIPLKTNKKRNLKPDLEILVDRLCIYQSVSVADLATTDEAKSTGGDTGNEVGDKLRDFCCNVILPFYRHKLPDLVKEISRKLGGPDLSPKRPANSSRTRSISQIKPGTALDPRRLSISQRTLERVLSEEHSSRQSSPPVLKRSATAPLGGGACSHTSVETVQRPSSRGSLQKSRSFTNREVDLVASNKAHTAKRKKLANLAKHKQELDAAIHALKKPNRGLAGMEIMAQAEKRRAEQDPFKRSTLGRTSSPQALNLQIAATPKKGAIRESTSRKALNLNWQTTSTTQQAADHPSLTADETAIPSSAVRPTNSNPHRHPSQPPAFSLLPEPNRHPIHASASATETASAIYETPSRRGGPPPHRTSNPLLLPDSHLFNSSPTTNTTTTIQQQTPSRTTTTLMTMKKSHRPVLFTPLSAADVAVHEVFRDAPIVAGSGGGGGVRGMGGSSGAGGAGGAGGDTGGRMGVGVGVGGGGGGGGSSRKEVSIYQALGWDDDDDDVDELL